MYDAFIDTLETVPRGLVYVALGLAILTLAKFARDILTPYRIDEQVTKNKNLAVSLRLAGYLMVHRHRGAARRCPYGYESTFDEAAESTLLDC